MNRPTAHILLVLLEASVVIRVIIFTRVLVIVEIPVDGWMCTTSADRVFPVVAAVPGAVGLMILSRERPTTLRLTILSANRVLPVVATVPGAAGLMILRRKRPIVVRRTILHAIPVSTGIWGMYRMLLGVMFRRMLRLGREVVCRSIHLMMLSLLVV